MNSFILSYNPLSARLSPRQLIAWIKESANVAQWYSPYAGTIILKSDKSIATLSDSFRAAFDGDSVVVAQVFPWMCGGALSPDIWAWLNGTAAPSLPTTIIPPMPPR